MVQKPTHKNNLNPLPTEHTDSSAKSSKLWIILAVILSFALVAVSIYSYMNIKNLNKKVTDQQAQITELQNKKKTLEDAAAAAASAATTAATNALTSSNFVEVKELGFKLPVTDGIKDLQYFVNDKTVFFSTKSLMSSAWGADSSDAAKYCAPGVLPLGAISKFSNTTEAGPTEQKNLGTFVLGYSPPQANCSNNAATIDLQNKQKAELLKAFSGAQKL